MESTKRSSLFLTKYFSIVHFGISLGLVITVAFQHVQFDMLQSQVSSLQEQLNKEVDRNTPISTKFKSRRLRATKDDFMALQQRIKINSTFPEIEVKNTTYSRRKKPVKEKERDVLTCLDMLRSFVKINSSKVISNINICGQLRGPPGKQGPRGKRGKKGKQGARGIPGQKGRSGSKGSKGKYGPPGPRGEKGFSGNVTVIGLKGAMGPKGNKGDKGNQGIEGQQGIKGAKGDSGGQKGDQGERGEKGEAGPRGCKGESFAAPQFHPTPVNPVFTEGQPATLVCNATAYPYSQITWYRDDVKITTGGRYDIKKNVTIPSVQHSMFCDIKTHPFTQSSLVINKSRHNDTGNYFCEARNVMGGFKYQISLLIQVYVQFTTIPSNITVVEKDNVTLSCRASGVPSPLITWQRKDGGQMPSVFQVVLGDLFITGITKEDEGVYECIASNFLGVKQTEATITVNVFPTISHFQEKVITVNESQSLYLPCNVTGFPSPVITWYKDNKSLPNVRYTYNSHHLTVSNVSYEDRGEYVCTANNSLGEVSKSTNVVVQVAPKIVRRPSATEYGYRGYNKNLVLKVFAFPSPSIEWYRSRRKIGENHSLVLRSVQYQHSGPYEAIARNILGEVRVTAFLIVRDPVPPSISSKFSPTVSITCHDRFPVQTCSAVGNPSPKIVWKRDNTVLMSGTDGSITLKLRNIRPNSAGQYTCEASNRFGKTQQHFNLVVTGDTKVQTSCNHNRISRWSGRITSPNYSGNYGNNVKCSWLLSSNCKIDLIFESFDTEAGYDKVIVYNGTSTSSPLIGEFSGSKIPSTMKSSARQLYITFNSDSSNIRSGFSIKYKDAEN